MVGIFTYIIHTDVKDKIADVREYCRIVRRIEALKRRKELLHANLFTGRVYWEPQIQACFTEIFRKSSDMETAVSAMPIRTEQCPHYKEKECCFRMTCPFFVYNRRYISATKKLEKLQAAKQNFWSNKFMNVK